MFVADEIAPELRSIVEFLNRQMTETEVLAIEVKQYVDTEGERQTIVPRVVGQTEAARAAKGTRSRAGGAAFDLATAPADVRELIEKMDAVADELGLTVRLCAHGAQLPAASIGAGRQVQKRRRRLLQRAWRGAQPLGLQGAWRRTR